MGFIMPPLNGLRTGRGRLTRTTSIRTDQTHGLRTAVRDPLAPRRPG